MKNLIPAAIIGILVSMVHLAGTEFRSPILSRLVDLLAIAAFPGTAVAQILGQVTGGGHGFTSSLNYVLVISAIVNTAFYWGINYRSRQTCAPENVLKAARYGPPRPCDS